MVSCIFDDVGVLGWAAGPAYMADSTAQIPAEEARQELSVLRNTASGKDPLEVLLDPCKDSLLRFWV